MVSCIPWIIIMRKRYNEEADFCVGYVPYGLSEWNFRLP